MKKGWIYVLVALGLLAGAVWALSRWAQQQIPDTVQIRYDVHLEGDTAEVRVRMAQAALRKVVGLMDSVRFDLTVDDEHLWQGRMDVDEDMQVGDSDTLQVPIKIAYRQMIDKLKALQDTDSVNYRLDGELRFAGWWGQRAVPFERTGRTRVPKLPQLSLDDVERDGRTFTLHLNVYNPNPAEIVVEGFNYDLVMGDSLLVTKGRSAESFTVPPFDTVAIPLEVRPENLRLLETLGRALIGQSFPYYMQVDIRLVPNPAWDIRFNYVADIRGEAELL